jgi:hypothetical protein
MSMRTWVVCITLGLVSLSAAANVDKIGRILEQQREIRDQTESSTGAYARFGSEALDRMHGAQEQIFELLDGVTTVEQLPPEQQAELFNALEEVKTVISQNEDNKQKCWRERKLGTTMRETRCATMAELRAVKQDSQSWQGSPSVCSGAGCGGNK